MKNTIACFLLGGLIAIAMPAQQGGEIDGFIELLRSDIRSEKIAVLTAAMALDEAEAGAFWPLQRDYERDLANINDDRLRMIRDFAEKWGSLSDDGAAAIAKDHFSIQERRLKLRKSTYKKMSKEIGSLAAARFIQIESAIQMLLDLQLTASLPLLE